MRMSLLLSALVVMLTGVAVGRAQVPAAADGGLSFEVASIRRTTSSERDHVHVWSSAGDGNFRAQNVSITDLLEFAYALPDSRFVAVGGTKSLLSAPRFDLEAKSSATVDERLHGLATEAAKDEKRKMVRAMLVGRFGLQLHAETRTLPIYTLVTAKGGPRFLASQAQGTSYSMSPGSLTIEGGDATVEKMADNLASILERPVVDATGIKGRYLLKLRWMPEDGAAPLLNGAPDPSLPSIFTAMEEQLGLKLVAGKGPVSVLVVDRVGLPSAN